MRRFSARQVLSYATLMLLSLVVLWTVVAQTEPKSDRDAIRSVLERWRDGVAESDADQVIGALSADFVQQIFLKADMDRANYLRSVGAGDALLSAIDVEHASYEVTNRNAIVESVVATLLETTPIVLSVQLRRANEAWHIFRVSQRPDLPLGLHKLLPKQPRKHRVEVRVVDSRTNAPLYSRVHVEDSSGAYWPPEGHNQYVLTGWRQDIGSGVVVGGKTFAYVEPDFALLLPNGEYELEVARGLETTPRSVRIRVEGAQESSLTVELDRWSDIRKDGWFSGDTHVHFLDPHGAFLEMRGEDINVVNILAAMWGEMLTNVDHFTGMPSLLSVPDHIIFVGEEARHGFLGHAVLLGISRLSYPLAWGRPTEGVLGAYDYPPMATHADRTHRMGGLVSWAHFPEPGGELAVDLALGRIDSIDLLTWGDAFADKNGEPGTSAASTWYRFLNCGFDLPATAGTDKMFNTQVVGSVRTYVKLEGPLTYEAWLDGIRAGRTFVTTGPMLRFSAGGAEVGDTLAISNSEKVAVEVEVNSRIPVERVEIVRGGEVIATRQNPEGKTKLRLSAELVFEDSSWVAARAYSSAMMPLQQLEAAGHYGLPTMAHTSPIYVTVDAKPRRSPTDAAVLALSVERSIEWVESEGRFLDPQHRTEMLSLFGAARKVYLDQAGWGDR